MVDVALVGCAHIHTPGFIRMLGEMSDRIRVAAVWDDDPQRGKVRADELSAPLVGDLQTIWKNKQIKAVIICSSTNRHEELVRAAARAKKHVFAEKPLGMGSRDSYRMAKAVQKAGVMFSTGYFSRSSAIHQFLRQQIRKGAFGQITRIRGSNCHSGALGGWFDDKPNDPANNWRWMADPTIAGCGGFGDLGTHLLDIMIWLIGPVQQVTAQTSLGTRRYEGCDEVGEGLIRFANGAIGTLAGSWDDLANPVTLMISGTQAHAWVRDGQLYFQSKNVQGADGQSPWTDLPPSWPHSFVVFCDAVCGKQTGELVNINEAAYCVAVMEAMYEGAAKGKWVKPKVPVSA